MEKIAGQFTQLKELLIEYFDSNLEYYKITGFEKLMRLVVAMTFVAVIFALIALAMLFSGIGVAIWLGDLLGNKTTGYLCIGLFYLLLLFLLCLLKKPLIERPLIKFFHRFLFKDVIKKDKPN